MECPGLPASGLNQPAVSCWVNPTKSKSSTSSYWDTEFKPTKESCCCTSTCADNRAVPSTLATQDLTLSSDKNTAPTTLTPGNQGTLSSTHTRDTATACLFKRLNSRCTPRRERSTHKFLPLWRSPLETWLNDFPYLLNMHWNLTLFYNAPACRFLISQLGFCNYGV